MFAGDQLCFEHQLMGKKTPSENGLLIVPTASLGFSRSQTSVCDLEKPSLSVQKMNFLLVLRGRFASDRLLMGNPG